MLAGNVDLIVNGAELRIIGDSLNNAIDIVGFSVTGQSGTTINATPSYTNANFSKIKVISIEMLGGVDNVDIRNLFVEEQQGVLKFDGGNGANRLKIEQAGFKHISIVNGATQNSNVKHRVTLTNTQVGDDANGTLSIQNGDGGSETTLDNGFSRSVHGNVTITNQDGDHRVNLTSRIRKGTVKITNGIGDNYVTIENVDKIKNVIVTNGRKGQTPSYLGFRLKDAQIETAGVNVTNYGHGDTSIINSTVKKNIRVAQSLTSRPLGSGSYNFISDVTNSTIGGSFTATFNDSAELSNNQDRSSRFIFASSNVAKATKLRASELDDSTLIVRQSSNLNAVTYDGGLSNDSINIEDSSLGKTNIGTSRGTSTTTIERSDFQSLKLENADRASLFDLFLPDTGYEQAFDTLMFEDSTVATKLQVIHGSGGSDSTIKQASIGQFQFRSNQGTDILKIDDAVFLKNSDIRTGTSVKKEIAAIGGLDEDQVLIETDASGSLLTEFRAKLAIKTYGGNDIISLGAPGTTTEVLFGSIIDVQAGDTDNAGLPGNSFEFDTLNLDYVISRLKTRGVENEQIV